MAGRVALKSMHGYSRATRDRAIDVGVRAATAGAVLDADLGADPVRIQLDDDQVIEEAIMAIGRAGYLVRERTVDETFDEQRIRAVDADNGGPLSPGHDVEQMLHVSRTAAAPFGFA